MNNINTNNLELASLKDRMRAFIIDDLLITSLTLIMLWNPISNVNGDIIAVMTILNKAFLQVVILKILYQTFFIWYYGATLGKIVTKTKIIDAKTLNRVSFTTSLIRAVVRIISESTLYFGFIVAYYTNSKQTLHDKLASTLVISIPKS